MNKNKIIMSSIGGAAVVIALVLGYLTYAAWEEKEENVETLESLQANVKRISSAKIAPSQASVDAINENKKTLEIWFARALDVASRGDRSYPTVTVAEFCNQLREDVAEARKLPGGVGGRLSAEDFSFGFRDIIDEGKLPKTDELPVLQRQWGDIKLFVETLAGAGAVQVTRIEKEGKKEPPEPQQQPVAQRGRNQRQPQKQEEVKPLADGQSYTLEFLARPPALVKAVNEFGKSERFIVIESLTFERTTDALGNILGGKDKEEARSSRGRGRRGRGRSQEEEPQEGEEEVRRKGLVVDPVTDTPFTVTMKITTYDFGSKGAAEASGEAKEGEEE